MKTHQCQIASEIAVALGPEARENMHSTCLGAYRRPDGTVEPCECECHLSDPVDLVEAAKGRLSVLDPSNAGAPADRGEKAKKGQKEASKTPSRPDAGRRCEHCGSPCRGRFLPGHDAKLKSELLRAASSGSGAAWAEIHLRGWSHLVTRTKVFPATRDEGERLARERGYALVEERTQARIAFRS